jgi:hypothetical protein
MVSIISGMRREFGLLLLGSILSGSSGMVKASGKYAGDPNEAAVIYYGKFCDDVVSEIEKRRNDPGCADKVYMIDRMLESSLFPYGLSYDTTLQYQDEIEDFVIDVFRDSARKTLKQSDLYRGAKKDLEDDILGLLGLLGIPKADGPADSSHLPTLSDDHGNTGNREPRQAVTTGGEAGDDLLGYGKVDTGIGTSVRPDELRMSAYARFGNLRLLGAGFDDAKIEIGKIGNKRKERFRAYLENAISEKIRYRFRFNFEGVRNPSTDVSLELTGEIVDGRWEVRVGHRENGSAESGSVNHEGGTYVTAGLVKRF